jgi:fructose transport system permease protein
VTFAPNYLIGVLDPAAPDFFGRTVTATFPANVYEPSKIARDMGVDYLDSIGKNHEFLSPVGTDAFSFTDGQDGRLRRPRITYGSILMVVLFGVFAWVLKNTAWGRHVYAVGDDAEAARLAGVRKDRELLSVYIVAGLICAVAAWMLIGRIASASPQAGASANLDSITAVVIGGTSLFGGRGRVVGTLFGALIVGVLRNGLTLSGVDVLWQDFAVGILIIAAVAIDQWIRKVKA